MTASEGACALSSIGPSLRDSLVFPQPEAALDSMTFVQPSHPAVRELADTINANRATSGERAVDAFTQVRDGVAYEFMAKLRPEEYGPAHVLEQRCGYCVQKAVLLASLLRACEIPSALVLSDLRDHTMSKRIVKAMGTDVMYGHGMVAAWVGEEWRLVDPSHDAPFAERKGYRLVEWNGQSDALIAPTTRDGRRHAEYVALRGVHLDLPFEDLLRTFAGAYSQADVPALAAAGVPVREMDAHDLTKLVR